MESCTFDSIAPEFDATVAEIAHAQSIDPVCSTSNWAIPLAEAFSRDAEHRVFASSAGYVALLEHSTEAGPVLTGFDSVWGFAAPIVGREPGRLIADLTVLLRRLDYFVLMVPCLAPDSPLFDEVQRLGPTGYTEAADRCVADLGQGFDGWLARRSPRFRRSLRAATNRGAARGVEIEHLRPSGSADALGAFERIMTIERASWKTRAGSGLVGTQLGEFTRGMTERFGASGGLRVQFAMLDGRDIGYVVGARVGDRYRGFQHSFDERHSELSIGKLMQFHTIQAMAAEGVRTYDMGMHMGYKESYADRIESTVTAIIPSGLRSGR